MYNLPKVKLHSAASANLPSTGQRRTMLLKALRKIQVSPEQGGDIQWPNNDLQQNVQVTVTVGYAISWIFTNNEIQVLDLRGQ